MITRHNPIPYTDMMCNPDSKGNMVFVDDIMEYLKEKRSEFLSDDTPLRRSVIENLMMELGEMPETSPQNKTFHMTKEGEEIIKNINKHTIYGELL